VSERDIPCRNAHERRQWPRLWHFCSWHPPRLSRNGMPLRLVAMGLGEHEDMKVVGGRSTGGGGLEFGRTTHAHTPPGVDAKRLSSNAVDT
jgi:hypothetical protein